MKKILILQLIILFLLIGCSSGTENNPQSDKLYANYTKCLNETGIINVEETPKTTIKWEFNNGILKIYHLNAGFNCCFDRIEISVEQNGKSINIIENDIGAKCDCNCPRDIDFMLKDIIEGTYTINIQEALYIDNYPSISFEANLNDGNSGELSFERPFYPWGITNF
jgi:hypothetical protein